MASIKEAETTFPSFSRLRILASFAQDSGREAGLASSYQTEERMAEDA
jgi:hypothetical protein